MATSGALRQSIIVWLEVRVLPGPPRILVLPEISRKIRPIRRHFAGGALSLRPRRGGDLPSPRMGATAILVLSYRIDCGTPPKNANARTWPSQKASVVSAG